MVKAKGSFVLEINGENTLEGQFLEENNKEALNEKSIRKSGEIFKDPEVEYDTIWDEQFGDCNARLIIKQSGGILDLEWKSKSLLCNSYKGRAMLYKERFLIGHYWNLD